MRLAVTLTAFATLALAALVNADKIGGREKLSVDAAETSQARPLKYQGRYQACMRHRQLKPVRGKGTFRDAKRCRAKMLLRAQWSVRTAIAVTFPAHARDDAEKVADCENAGAGLDNRRARTGAAGELSHWQIHPFWFGHMSPPGRISAGELRESALFATRVAQWLWRASGKTFRTHWVICSRVTGAR